MGVAVAQVEGPYAQDRLVAVPQRFTHDRKIDAGLHAVNCIQPRAQRREEIGRHLVTGVTKAPAAPAHQIGQSGAAGQAAGVQRGAATRSHRHTGGRQDHDVPLALVLASGAAFACIEHHRIGLAGGGADALGQRQVASVGFNAYRAAGINTA